MTSNPPQEVAQAATDPSLAAEELDSDLQRLELNPELIPWPLDTAKIARNRLRNTPPLIPGLVSQRARVYRLERLEKQQVEKEREKEWNRRLAELNTGNLAQSPRKETAEDIIEQLKGLCDDVIEDYRDLPEKMGYNRRKVVKTGGVRPLSTSKSKGKGKTTAVPKDEQWMTEGHLFSKKSKLPEIDLQSYLAKPETWNILSAEEKASIRALLPETTPYNPDGSPTTEFLEHATDWRKGVGQFQADVKAGRMEPKWQTQAGAAMEMRAAGKLDDFKELEYEAFWGQKQKLPRRVSAGVASRVRLEEMVNAGVFQVGDVWSYTRAFGRRQRILVEKEVTIGQIQNGLLVFLIPPGQHRYMPARYLMDVRAAAEATFMEDAEETMSEVGQVLHEEPASEHGTLLTKSSIPELGTPLPGSARHSSPTLGSYDLNAISATLNPKSSPKRKPLPHPPTLAAPSSPALAPTGPAPAPTASAPAPTTIYTHNDYSSSIPPPGPTINKTRIFAVDNPGALGDPSHPQILRVKRLHGLERKILEMDGRAKYDGKDSSWKYIRCLRNTKNLGSLWELRKQFYEDAYGYPGKVGGRSTTV